MKTNCETVRENLLGRFEINIGCSCRRVWMEARVVRGKLSAVGCIRE